MYLHQVFAIKHQAVKRKVAEWRDGSPFASYDVTNEDKGCGILITTKALKKDRGRVVQGLGPLVQCARPECGKYFRQRRVGHKYCCERCGNTHIHRMKDQNRNIK